MVRTVNMGSQDNGSIKEALEKDLQYNISGAARRGARSRGVQAARRSIARQDHQEYQRQSTSGAARHGVARSTLINKSASGAARHGTDKNMRRGTARHGEEHEEL